MLTTVMFFHSIIAVLFSRSLPYKYFNVNRLPYLKVIYPNLVGMYHWEDAYFSRKYLIVSL